MDEFKKSYKEIEEEYSVVNDRIAAEVVMRKAGI